MSNTPGNDNTPPAPPAGTPPPAPPLSFDDWLGKQGDDIKALISGHTDGLSKSLSAERDQRKLLAKQLAEIGKTPEENGKLKAALDDVTKKLADVSRRERFTDDAVMAKAINPKLLWHAATGENLVDADGKADFAELRKRFPELFVKPPAGNAGNGSGGAPPQPADMNGFIRRSAGRS